MKCGILTKYHNTILIPKKVESPQNTLKIKQEASGWPEWCLTDQDKHTYIKNYFEKEGWKRKTLKRIQNLEKTNVVIAAYTTAQARLQFYKYFEKLDDRVLYCDTDSIIFASKPVDWRPMTGDYLSDLTDELPNNNIDVFVSGGPKNYAFKLIKPDKAGNQTCCKIRGIMLNYKNSLELNFEIVKEMVKGRMKSVTVTDEYKIRRNVKSSDIITCVEEKDYRIVFDKRVLKDNYKTVPYGM
ncbi:unnamed protein product [Mytilus coruscus]|uniref:Uncharacterized protein n=1 Tax=Mytilus coruscus TaxID=42192 RepID=A0A6J8C9A4_MYTCO|nr:unnamed protein product [Mytilus coruscus]